MWAYRYIKPMVHYLNQINNFKSLYVERGILMSVYESILVAFFVMAIVFIVLIALSLFLSLQSSFFNFFKNKKASNIISPAENTIEFSTDRTAFIGVDEKTIAIIIASISYASNTPLNSLKIKSIKPLDL